MSRILVTGASGFLGAAVAEQLQRENIPVRRTGRSGEHDSLTDYWPADLRYSTALPEMLSGVTGIVHCAGLAHQFGPHKPHDSRYYGINCEATEQLARTAAAQGVQRFVFVSSVSVYGPSQETAPRNEEAVPHPVGAYAKSKREAEIRLLRIAAETGLQVFILRMGTLYGEGDPGNVGRLMNTIRQGRFLMIGPGTNRKSLLHRDDAAQACVRAVLHPTNRPAGIWNITAGHHSMKEIVENLAAALDRTPPQRHIPAPLADGLLRAGATLGVGPVHQWAKTRWLTVRKWLAEDAYDGSRFAKEFHWQPQITLEEGFQRLVTKGHAESLETARHAA